MHIKTEYGQNDGKPEWVLSSWGEKALYVIGFITVTALIAAVVAAIIFAFLAAVMA